MKPDLERLILEALNGDKEASQTLIRECRRRGDPRGVFGFLSLAGSLAPTLQALLLWSTEQKTAAKGLAYLWNAVADGRVQVRECGCFTLSCHKGDLCSACCLKQTSRVLDLVEQFTDPPPAPGTVVYTDGSGKISSLPANSTARPIGIVSMDGRVVTGSVMGGFTQGPTISLEEIRTRRFDLLSD